MFSINSFHKKMPLELVELSKNGRNSFSTFGAKVLRREISSKHFLECLLLALNHCLVYFHCIGKALDKALEQSYELFKKHGRHSARKVLIVFTNGKSAARANELKKHAQNLAEMNTKLIMVAIGDEVSVEELLEVTSNEESIVRAQPEDDHQKLVASIVRNNIEGNGVLGYLVLLKRDFFRPPVELLY